MALFTCRLRMYCSTILYLAKKARTEGKFIKEKNAGMLSYFKFF